MVRNLRRSRRSGGSASKRTSAYNVDDIVEVTRGNARIKARLVAQLSDSTSSSTPRWLIKFDGLSSLKDEEVHEDSFAKPSSSDNSDSDDRRGETYSLRGGRLTRNSTRSRYGIPIAADDPRRHHPNSNLRRHHPHHPHHPDHHPHTTHHSSGQYSNLPSEESETGGDSSRAARLAAAKRASAREVRSKRRQAKIDEETTVSSSAGAAANTRKRSPPPPPTPGKRARTTAGHHHHHHLHHATTTNNNRNEDGGGGGTGEVVKVKLLTGTLYLYRGLHRRAEFVRRV